MGGLAKALVFGAGLIVAILSRPLFMYEIMNSLFMVYEPISDQPDGKDAKGDPGKVAEGDPEKGS